MSYFPKKLRACWHPADVLVCRVDHYPAGNEMLCHSCGQAFDGTFIKRAKWFVEYPQFAHGTEHEPDQCHPALLSS